MNPICLHCGRGNPQNTDISFKAIENILKGIAELEYLTLTGGEPLINLPAMEFIIKCLKKYSVRLHHFSLTTNGLILPEKFCKLILELYTYISSLYDDAKIVIFYSVDQFHTNNYGKEFYEKFQKRFNDYERILICGEWNGSNPISIKGGKSENLVGAINQNPYMYTMPLVEYCDDKHTPDCPALTKDPHRKYPYILCPLYLSVKGYLYGSNALSNSYSVIDSQEYIADMNEEQDILECAKHYNKGKQNCKYYHKKYENIEEKVIQFVNTTNKMREIDSLRNNGSVTAENIHNRRVELLKKHPFLRFNEIVKLDMIYSAAEKRNILQNINRKDRNTIKKLFQIERLRMDEYYNQYYNENGYDEDYDELFYEEQNEKSEND